MTEEHPPAVDHVKLIAAAVLLAASCLTGLGMIPAAILFGGAALAIRTEDFSKIQSTSRIVKAGLKIAAIISMLATVVFACYSAYSFGIFVRSYNGYEEYVSSKYWRNIGFLASIGIAACGLLVNSLWLEPLERQFGHIVERMNAFRNRPRRLSQPAIFKWEKFASYSAADELRKWHALHKEGAISDDEYTSVRAEILNRN